MSEGNLWKECQSHCLLSSPLTDYNQTTINNEHCLGNYMWLTFLQVKFEVRLLMGCVRMMEHIYQKKFRVLLIIDDLEKCQPEDTINVLDVRAFNRPNFLKTEPVHFLLFWPSPPQVWKAICVAYAKILHTSDSPCSLWKQVAYMLRLHTSTSLISSPCKNPASIQWPLVCVAVPAGFNFLPFWKVNLSFYTCEGCNLKRDSLMVNCWAHNREVLGSNPSHGGLLSCAWAPTDSTSIELRSQEWPSALILRMICQNSRCNLCRDGTWRHIPHVL